jgi:pimeloyl-ACP methyl ester carboxylesterase
MKSLLVIFIITVIILSINANQVRIDFKTIPRTKDDDYYRNVTQLIEARGYPWEQHYATTPDGFILSIQRIPHGRNNNNNKYSSNNSTKPVVFLQHGLLDASETWVQNFENESLAFILADAGCDVWLGNARGNIYSAENTKWKPTDSEFWMWSWDDLALVDLPTMIEYVLKQTERKQLDAYIGHSQGTAMGFACFSTKECGGSVPLSERVKLFVALAPVTYVAHVESTLLRILATVHLDELLVYMGLHDFFPSSKILQRLVPDICSNTLIGRPFCAHIYCLFAGCDSLMDNVNQTRLPTYFSHLPAGTSVINIAHWAQEVRSGRFERLDYGSPEKNREHYGQDKPPKFDLTQLNVDVAMFHGGKDILGTVADFKEWLPMLPKHRVKQVKFMPNYGHLDVVWGIHANTDIYADVVKLISDL